MITIEMARGTTAAGRIVAFAEYQVQDFYTKEPRFFPSGDPIMGVRIILEQTPGDADSRVALRAQGGRMLRAIATAVKAQGAKDLEHGAYLTVTRTEEAYEATYARPEVL
jgi:hypothetical protein